MSKFFAFSEAENRVKFTDCIFGRKYGRLVRLENRFFGDNCGEIWDIYRFFAKKYVKTLHFLCLKTLKKSRVCKKKSRVCWNFPLESFCNPLTFLFRPTLAIFFHSICITPFVKIFRIFLVSTYRGYLVYFYINNYCCPVNIVNQLTTNIFNMPYGLSILLWWYDIRSKQIS